MKKLIDRLRDKLEFVWEYKGDFIVVVDYR